MHKMPTSGKGVCMKQDPQQDPLGGGWSDGCERQTALAGYPRRKRFGLQRFWLHVFAFTWIVLYTTENTNPGSALHSSWVSLCDAAGCRQNQFEVRFGTRQTIQ